MSTLTEIFKGAQEEPQDNEKLVDLFRNRAELKKEFAALRNEKYQLQDRIKQQQGATARVQQKMEHLENLLLDREWVHNVVTFYQLRRLALHCNARLARFAEELKQQREQRVHGEAIEAWNAECSEKTRALETAIEAQQSQMQLLEGQLQSERNRLAGMGGFSRMVKGKRLSADIADIESQIEVCRAEEFKLRSELANIRTLNPPQQEGLDVAAKRSINFMILSFAQQLYLMFEEDDLASLSKEANEKSVGAINYGTKYECDEILKRIDRRWDTLESVTEYAGIFQQRAKLIANDAVFRHNEDVIPSAGSVATVFQFDENGGVSRKYANILGDNYFAISKVLSR